MRRSLTSQRRAASSLSKSWLTAAGCPRSPSAATWISLTARDGCTAPMAARPPSGFPRSRCLSRTPGPRLRLAAPWSSGSTCWWPRRSIRPSTGRCSIAQPRAVSPSSPSRRSSPVHTPWWRWTTSRPAWRWGDGRAAMRPNARNPCGCWTWAIIWTIPGRAARGSSPVCVRHCRRLRSSSPSTPSPPVRAPTN